MIVARWQIEVRFGHKEDALKLMQRWSEEVGSAIGWPKERTRLLTGSVGASEALLSEEIELESLAELSAGFDKMAEMPAHRQWSRDLEPHIVSGSNRWEVFRVL